MKIEIFKYEDPYLEKISEINKFISNNDMQNVCKTMPAIGMQAEFNKEYLDLVKLCLKNDDEWIRRAGYLTLYHFYIRYREKICNYEIIDLWLHGKKDQSEVVSSIVNDTLDEIKEFSPGTYEKIIGKNNY